MTTTRSVTTRTPRFRLSVAIAAFLSASMLAGQPGVVDAAERARPPALEHLTPGRELDVALDIPVNVVFVGLEEGAGPTGIDVARLLAEQPGTAEPIILVERDRGDEAAEFGLEYRYDIRSVFADAAFEDAFFGYLAGSAYGPFDADPIQRAYSNHPLASETITTTWVLDASAVESWLIEHAGPMLGVDTSRPTVFFLNWYGRPDFRFHTYATVTSQPEVDFFAPFSWRGHSIAWGGSTPDDLQAPVDSLGRVWFMDLSAGPELQTANWFLERGDITGDGIVDERIPPIWEYGTSHWYRAFSDLTGDLAKVLRYVAIDMLFTASPVFDPTLSPPLVVDELELDLNVFVDGAQHDPFRYLLVDEVVRRLSALDPSRSFSADTALHAFTPELDRALDCAVTTPTPEPPLCRPGADGDFALNDLLVWATHHDTQYLDGVRGEIPAVHFDVPDQRLGPVAGISFLQQWVMNWTTPIQRAFRFSPTYTMTHEVGHYLGLRHPHDGYDAERRQLIQPYGPFFFAWLGDSTATTMSYRETATDFSQFDRDNLDRWMTVMRLQHANTLLGEVYASPRGGDATSEVRAADDHAGVALRRLHDWDLRGASLAARDAYRAAFDATMAAGIKVEPWSPWADVNNGGPFWNVDVFEEMAPHIPPGIEVEDLDDPQAWFGPAPTAATADAN